MMLALDGGTIAYRSIKEDISAEIAEQWVKK